MLKLRKVAITGGLSCGKSSVCRILKELGAYIVSADKIVHQLLSSDTNLGQEVVNLLGSDILVNQKLDRSRIAHLVFHDMELLQAYEKLVHPAVYREIDEDYQRQRKGSQPPPLFVAEIPLLFESGGKRDFDYTIAVVANLDICCKRFEEATGYDQTEFNNRMTRQFSLFDKAILADYVIMNNGTLSDLQQTTKELYLELIEG
jgi:dephospho-CoA kinase